jgi:O-antigen ligase
MSHRQVIALLIFGSAIVIAICAGISIATENYVLLTLAVCAVALVLLIVTPGYIPLLVFGLLSPLALPLPFIVNFPFFLFALGICVLKYWLERGLTLHRRITPISTLNLSCGLFFAWVFLRYCISPSIPNLLGFGRNVTGFRAWLNYALCFGVMCFLGRFIINRQGLVKLIRWMVWVSAFFTVILLAAAFSKNPFLAAILTYFGMYVITFDNGVLRLVALPGFGLILFSLAFLPNLLKLNKYARIVIAALGIAAIFVGGNRSSFGGALVILVTIPLLRREFLHAAATIGCVVIIAVTGYLAGPALSRLPETGFLRPLALVSPELAKATGGENTLEWREERWERAIEEIQNHPLIGRGYGGVEEVEVVGNALESDELSKETSLATGGIHNGYLACSLALGIPAALFFVFLLLSHIVINAHRAYRLQKEDPVAGEAHGWVCTFLLINAVGVFFAADLNDHMIWFYIALGLFLIQMRARERPQPRPERSPVRAVQAVQPVLGEQVA